LGDGVAADLPKDRHQSRGAAGYPAGYRRLSELAPGPWFNSVSPLEYHKRFMAQLNALDAAAIVQCT
jgi:hypothetical protein